MNRAVSETSYLVQALLYLPYFWFVEGVRYFTRTVWRVIVYLDQITATTLMARLLFIPLFGGYRFFGFVCCCSYSLFGSSLTILPSLWRFLRPGGFWLFIRGWDVPISRLPVPGRISFIFRILSTNRLAGQFFR